jgi:choline transport protein
MTNSYREGTLLAFFILIMTAFINIYGSKILPASQSLFMFLHVSVFITVIAVLWSRAEHVEAKYVFTSAGFEFTGGWSKSGLSLMVGQMAAVYALICTDSAAHMAEEVPDAGITVPQAIFWPYILNGAMGLVFLITFLFAMPSVDDALGYDYTFFYVYQQALPTAGVQVLVALILVIFYGGSLNINASAARQTFAFARDRGMPGSKWLGKVDSKLNVPANAIWFSLVLSLLLV